MVKNLPASAGDARDVALIPVSGRSPGGGHGSPLQFLAWRIPVDRGTWQATVHGVTRVSHDRAGTHGQTSSGVSFSPREAEEGMKLSASSLSWDLSPDCPCSLFHLL